MDFGQKIREFSLLENLWILMRKSIFREKFFLTFQSFLQREDKSEDMPLLVDRFVRYTLELCEGLLQMWVLHRVKFDENVVEEFLKDLVFTFFESSFLEST